jgi:hypothetical protein
VIEQADLFGARPPAFYNTNKLAGDELRAVVAAALTQEQRILALFRARPDELLSPEDVMAVLPKHTPLTSARRAITCLTSAGKLVKTSAMRKSKYGKPMHLWTLNQHD